MDERIKNIERRIKEIAKEYGDKGFKVVVSPKPSQLPQFLKDFQPDIIAMGEKESVVVEVKTTKGRPSDLKQFKRLAEEIAKRKNWRFELVFTNPIEPRISRSIDKTLGQNKIKERIKSIDELYNIQQYEASFLLAWATLEAVVRQKLQNEKSDSLNKPTLSIIKTLFSLGLVNNYDYRKLEKFNTSRNYLIHGFEHKIDRFTVQEVINLLKNLIGEGKESEMKNFLIGLDLEHYEEIYALYETVTQKQSIGGFTYSETDNKIIIAATYLDSTLELESDSDRKQLAKLIEQEYMDDISPEVWYTFKREMEKDD